MIAEIDSNRNGKVDFDEFVRFMVVSNKNPKSDPKQELRDAFKVFDRDGNGKISATEFKFILTNLGDALTQEEVDDVIGEVDVDGDGQINFEEFANLMTKQKN
eukprot:c13101_g1_i6.p1 GENE.c13101_g1_i6~~c13101_g1_i6.p1  ORF type:complete len:103 (-),score=33.67 c13101_g1_i6:110-418(-)